MKGLIVIKKINATKNFNAGAIITIPKRQLLAQTHVIQHIDQFTRFLHNLRFYPTPKSYALQCLSIGQKFHFPWGHIYTPCNVFSGPSRLSKLHLDWFSRFLHSSQQGVPILHNVH